MSDNGLKTCYTCLQNVTTSTDLQAEDVDCISYLYKLSKLLTIDMIYQETMGICTDCIDQLRISFKFQELVTASQESWRKYFEEINMEVGGIETEENDVSGLIEKEDVALENKQNPEENSPSNSDDKDDNNDNYHNSESDSEVTDNDNSFRCSKCSKIFSNEKLLLHDCFKSSRTRKLKCSKCLKVFSSEAFLSHDCCKDNQTNSKNNKRESRKEVKAEGNINENITQECNICKEKFENRGRLVRHIRNVHNQATEYKYKCNICENTFKNSIKMKEHLTIHTGVKSFSCNICEKQFRLLSSQQRHMKSHSAPLGQKSRKTPFLCNICGRRFPYSNSYQRHMRVHLGIKSHQCHICNRKFGQSTHLNVHMRTHTGEKPFVCDVCGEAFSLKASLDKHISKIHRGEPSHFKYMCSLCGQNFRKSSDLRLHLNRIHCNIDDTSEDDDNFNNSVSEDTGASIRKSSCVKQSKMHEETPSYSNLTCSFCGEHFSNNVDFYFHIKRKHDDNEYATNVIVEDVEKDIEAFTLKPSRIHDVEVQRGESARFDFLCQFCKQSFLKDADLQSHVSKIHFSGESSKSSNCIISPRMSPRKISRNMPTLLF